MKRIPNFSPLFYILHWKEIRDSIKERKGKCKRCGKCCKGCEFIGRFGCELGFLKPIMCHLYPNRIDGLKRYKECGFRLNK